ncbi:protein lethal(3)malignant blood neoplasm 1 isoform X3 [Lucilia cuprina]|uniref:protein lethal(3)malignant blood neoplasm 1 isoform X3 n=1 Tax=Lucilia cuprina TaxID=7375 RepID=UPI001F06B5F4|nr:protein lethal(3)malignant blood neoplasm 1 isoform X3 [Lucilia cuprina]
MKYLISLFMIVVCCLQQCCWAQSTTVRPYKFGFTIDEQQHRSESRDERGIVMGEFGFITADGIYHVTVYATDEQGRFRILAMRNYPYESPPKTVEVMVQPKIAPTTTTTAKPLPKHNFNTEACSGCFLTNGNNKPKGLNGIESKTVKNDIRPLSKSLSTSGTNAAVNPKIPNKNVGAAQENTLTKIPTKNSFEPQNTDTTAQENTLTQTPLKNSVGDLDEASTQGKKTQLKLMLEQPSEADLFPQAAANPATLNKNSGKQPIQTTPNTNTLNKQYTTSPTVSKNTNQKTVKPLSGSPDAAKTNTGNPPPIMDIIMQKVLPAIMGKTPSATPTQTTTLNKPNVPSGKKPNGISGSSSSSPSANGDGDLYRFKYILDYHGHTETGKRNGNKEGTYYAIGDDDVERTIEYVANENGYQPRIRWRKLDRNEIKSKENTLKDYEFVWFNQ